MLIVLANNEEVTQMRKLQTPPPAPTLAAAPAAHLSSARLSAVVEAAYILEAVRR
jgi:hypothetical protein